MMTRDNDRCPNCRGRVDRGSRHKVRGAWWCLACSRGVQRKLNGHDTAEIRRVATLNAGAGSAPDDGPGGLRIAADEDRAELGAIVAFLRLEVAESSSARRSWSVWREAMARLERIADGIERDRLSPAAAVARLASLVGTLGVHRKGRARIATPPTPPELRIATTPLALAEDFTAEDIELVVVPRRMLGEQLVLRGMR